MLVTRLPAASMRRGADATRRQIKIYLQTTLPAAGTNAAVNWRDYGRSRWQLSEKIYTDCRRSRKGRSSYFAAREAARGPVQAPPPSAAASGRWGAPVAGVMPTVEGRATPCRRPQSKQVPPWRPRSSVAESDPELIYPSHLRSSHFEIRTLGDFTISPAPYQRRAIHVTQPTADT
jgi:hypothetical protein